MYWLSTQSIVCHIQSVHHGENAFRRQVCRSLCIRVRVYITLDFLLFYHFMCTLALASKRQTKIEWSMTNAAQTRNQFHALHFTSHPIAIFDIYSACKARTHDNATKLLYFLHFNSNEFPYCILNASTTIAGDKQ